MYKSILNTSIRLSAWIEESSPKYLGTKKDAKAASFPLCNNCIISENKELRGAVSNMRRKGSIHGWDFYL